MAGKILSWQKDKAVITIEFAPDNFNLDNVKKYHLDISKGKWYNEKGRELVFRPAGMNRNTIYDQTTIPHIVFKYLLTGCFGHYYSNDLTQRLYAQNLQDNEEWLSVMDIIGKISYFSPKDYTLNGKLSELPKGFIKYLRDTNQCFSYSLLQDYVNKQNGKNFPQNDKYFLNYLSDKDFLLYKQVVQNGASLEYYKFKAIISNTIKHYILNIYNDDLKEIWNYLQYCDKTKDIEENKKIIQEIVREEKRKKLALEQSKLKGVNNLVFGDNQQYQIVIPLCVKDLVKEGEQQHNCVGSHYNDSIINKKNYILFIRHSSNPAQSYITARYSIRMGKIVEARLKNNDSISIDDWQFVRQAEDIINNYLNI